MILGRGSLLMYACKHQPDELPEGTLVLLENTAQKQRKGGKLCPAWLGPYTISKNLGKGVYELKNTAGNIVRKKVNISRLKVYTYRDGQEPKSGKDDNDKGEKGEEKNKKEEEEKNDSHECSKKKEERKRKRVAHSERATKKHRMAEMSESIACSKSQRKSR